MQQFLSHLQIDESYWNMMGVSLKRDLQSFIQLQGASRHLELIEVGTQVKQPSGFFNFLRGLIQAKQENNICI
jgi:hypothetical protein